MSEHLVRHPTIRGFCRMDEAIDRGKRHGRIGEVLVPFGSVVTRSCALAEVYGSADGNAKFVKDDQGPLHADTGRVIIGHKFEI